MLVLGNLAASAFCDDIRSNVVEILHNNSTEKEVKKTLKLKGKPLWENKFSELFKVGAKKYILHNVDELFVLSKMYEEVVGEREWSFASRLHMYAWAKGASRFRHHDVREWESSCRVFNQLHKKHFSPVISKESAEEANRLASKLLALIAYSPTIKNGKYEFLDFNYFTRDSMLEWFAGSEPSLYKELLPKNSDVKHIKVRDYLNFTTWMKMEHEDRIGAILERLYVDASNEVFVDEIMQGRGPETHYDGIDQLKRMAMIAASEMECQWFSIYIRLHIDEIMFKADMCYPEHLADAILTDKLVETIF